MKILRAADHKVMPWKNGAGSTTEIAISPSNAALDAFDWRVSMATVAVDGAFSSFAGIDRTLLVLRGKGLVLSVSGHQPACIDATTMHSFPGDQPTSATLIDGPITDLNVMSRHDRVQHRVQRIIALAPLDIPIATESLLVVERGTLEVNSATCRVTLSAYDAVLLNVQSPVITLRAASEACVIVAQFWRKSSESDHF